MSILFKGNLEEGNYILIKSTDGWVLKGETSYVGFNFADRKTENSSEKPNNYEDESKYEMGMGTLKCDNCSEYGSFKCTKCDGEMYFKRLEPKDEPTISKMEQVEEPKICDTCRYYNSNIPCGSTPSACKKADKFAEEFVDGLKKLKPKGEPQTDCAWK